MFNIKMISTAPVRKTTVPRIMQDICSGKIRFIIFDCDGVLADTEPSHILARRAAIAELAAPITMSDEEMLRWSKGFHNDDGILSVLLHAPETKDRFAPLEDIPGSTDLNAPGLTDEQRALLKLVKDVGSRKRQNFCAIMARIQLPENPGLGRFLGFLEQQNVHIALASANEDAFEVVLSLKREAFFDQRFVFTGHRLGTYGDHIGRIMRNKQDMFEELMRMSGNAPEQVLGFEDAGHGISAFQKLGITAIGMDTESSGEVAHADLGLNTFDDLFE